jgi:hypothetical protein
MLDDGAEKFTYLNELDSKKPWWNLFYKKGKT